MIHYQKTKTALICLCLVVGFSLEVFAKSNTVVNQENCIQALSGANSEVVSEIQKLASKENLSPMEYVIRHEYKNVASKFEALTKAGHEIPQRFSDGKSPMEWVIRHTYFEDEFKTKVEVLIEAGFEIPQRFSNGMTPIEWMIQHTPGTGFDLYTFKAQLEVLIEAGFEIPQRFSNGMTPMEWVIRYVHRSDFKYQFEALMEAGVNIPQRFSNGTTPMEYVMRLLGYDRKIKLEALQKAGIKSNLQHL